MGIRAHKRRTRMTDSNFEPIRRAVNEGVATGAVKRVEGRSRFVVAFGCIGFIRFEAHQSSGSVSIVDLISY